MEAELYKQEEYKQDCGRHNWLSVSINYRDYCWCSRRMLVGESRYRVLNSNVAYEEKGKGISLIPLQLPSGGHQPCINVC